MEEKRYRVAQWATGHTGMQSLRNVIDHPRFDLVGLYVYSDAKVGRDAGDICDRPPAGVVATRDIEAIVAAKPDCVLYMPLIDHESIDDMCVLLESGISITTPVVTFYYPPGLDPDVRKRLEAACAKGGASLFGTGPGPGWILVNLPLVLTLMERRVDRLSITQYADIQDRQSPDLIAGQFGMSPADAPNSRATGVGRADGACMRQFAEAVGTPIDEVTREVEWAVANKTTKIGVTTIEAGTVGAWRMKITGLRDGKPFFEFLRHWYVTKDVDPAWDLHHTSWQVHIEGDAPMDVEIKFPTENYASYMAGVNSHVVVNSVPATVEAAPGLLTPDRVPLVPYFG